MSIHTKLRLGGIILCGGKSARMGSDKAWLPVGHEHMLQRVAGVVQAAASPTVVVAGQGQRLPELGKGVEIATDRYPDRGPLEGLLSGLELVSSRCEAVFVTGCDYPFLDPGLVSFFAERFGDAEAVMARVAGQLHPLAALYRVSVVEQARELYATHRRSMHALAERCVAHVVESEELVSAPGGTSSFINVNTPAEYESALVRLGRR